MKRALMYSGVGALLASGGITVIDKPIQFFSILILVALIDLIKD